MPKLILPFSESIAPSGTSSVPSSLPLSVMSNVAVLDCQHLFNTKSNKISTASEIKRNMLDLSDEVPVDEGCLCGQVCGGVSGGSARGRAEEQHQNPEPFQKKCACVNVETSQRGFGRTDRHWSSTAVVLVETPRRAVETEQRGGLQVSRTRLWGNQLTNSPDTPRQPPINSILGSNQK